MGARCGDSMTLIPGAREGSDGIGLAPLGDRKGPRPGQVATGFHGGCWAPALERYEVLYRQVHVLTYSPQGPEGHIC